MPTQLLLDIRMASLPSLQGTKQGARGIYHLLLSSFTLEGRALTTLRAAKVSGRLLGLRL